MYTWLSDQEFDSYSTVTDTGINEALQEVRSVMPDWYIQENSYNVRPNWFKKPKTKYTYNVFCRTNSDSNEARYQMSATTRYEVLNLLYGLYMGYKFKEIETTKG